MRVLAVSDEESKYYYDHYVPGRLDEFGLILACGDLRREYLEFLATLAHCPVLYVHGNHDGGFDRQPPGGCICVEDRIYVHNGVRVLGLGGSFRYRPGEHMYTEAQMSARILRLRPQLWRHGGFDILLTHAPARGINDLEDRAHRGFQCFTALLDRYEPAYFVHGHIHRSYGPDIPQKTVRGATTVYNACGHCRFDL